MRVLLPHNKHDLNSVLKLQTVGHADIEPLLDGLVDWIADGNWPVAKPIADILLSTGAPAIPALRKVLQGTDAIHQYFCLLLVVSRFSPEIAILLRRELTQIADDPTARQIDEGVSQLAEDILRGLANGSSMTHS